MADGFVQVATDGSGKKVDASELTVGANTVERQRVVIGDPASAAGLAVVATTTPGSTDPGLVVRDPIIPVLADLAGVISYLAAAIHDRLPIADNQERLRVYIDQCNGAYAGFTLNSIGNGATGATYHLVNVPFNLSGSEARSLYDHITAV